MRDRTAEPYRLFVRVSASPSSMLADAGIELVPEVEHDLGDLTGTRDAGVLQIPRAVDVVGTVTEMDGGQIANLLHSQVTISARDAAVPTAPRVVETSSGPVRRDGGVPPNLRVQLEPLRHYDVRVQPLSAASGRLPPFTQTDVGPDRPLMLEAPNVEARSGRFIYRDESQRAEFARLEEKGTGRILSSTAHVEQGVATTSSGEERREGVFTLYAEPGVFRLRNFDLVISLGGYAPWQITLQVDGERFLSGGDMFLPAAPAPVTVANVVEDEYGARLAGSEIIFVSSYRPAPEIPADEPSTPAEGEVPAPPTEFGSDWCRWQDPGGIACRGRFQTLSDENGDYSISLIPGRYDVFIVPPVAARTRNIIVTQHGDDSNPGVPPVLVGEGTGMNRLILQADVAAPFKGTVLASDAPAAGVTVRALRRPTPSPSSWGLVAEFNRTFSVVSDRKGHFSIAPDVGYYDYVFEPELGSDFPWKLWLDCPNGPGAGGSLAAVALSAPVIVFGSVEFEDSGVRLPGAKIEAFTIVEAKNREPRSVMIGRAVSDENGDYILALPPLVGEDTERCDGVARPVTDNGRSAR